MNLDETIRDREQSRAQLRPHSQSSVGLLPEILDHHQLDSCQTYSWLEHLSECGSRCLQRPAHRKSSTSMRSLSNRSMQLMRNCLPSGEAEKPGIPQGISRSTVAMSVVRFVVKS